MAEEGLEGIAQWAKITQNKSSFQVLCERSERIQFEAMNMWKYEWVIFGVFFPLCTGLWGTVGKKRLKISHLLRSKLHLLQRLSSIRSVGLNEWLIFGDFPLLCIGLQGVWGAYYDGDYLTFHQGRWGWIDIDFRPQDHLHVDVSLRRRILVQLRLGYQSLVSNIENLQGRKPNVCVALRTCQTTSKTKHFIGLLKMIFIAF